MCDPQERIYDGASVFCETFTMVIRVSTSLLWALCSQAIIPNLPFRFYHTAAPCVFQRSPFLEEWQRLKNMGLVKGPGSLFATRLVTESGGVATNLPCTCLLKTTVLYTEGPRHWFVTERGGGDWTKLYFESLPYASTHTYTNAYNTYTYA